MSANKLQQIQSLLLDVIIYCTEEAECDQHVVDELHSIKERIYKLEKKIPEGGPAELYGDDQEI